jgi:hypothetical protein
VIRFEQGDILAATTDALVKPVHAELTSGHLIVHDTGTRGPRRYVIDFPTKREPRDKSRLIDIDLGLSALVEAVHTLEIASLAIPALGCADGDLSWTDVRPLIKAACDQFPDVLALVYAPVSVTGRRDGSRRGHAPQGGGSGIRTRDGGEPEPH